MKVASVPVFLLIMTLLGFALQAEDIVTLVNGNQIKGIVTSETTSSVVVENNGIQVRLKRIEISSIERMGDEARKLAIQESKAPRPHEEDYYPEIARPMFHALAELDALKLQWTTARDKTESLDRRLSNTQAEIVMLDLKIKVGRKQLEGFSLDTHLSTLANNKRIEDHNLLVKQTNHFTKQLQSAISNTTSLKTQIESSNLAASEKRRAYVRQAHRLGKNWVLLEKQVELNGSLNSEGFVELRRRLNAHPVAFQSLARKDEPPYVLTLAGDKKYTLPRAADGHFYVTASLNQIQYVDFLIDTGATISLLPESIGKAVGARKIGPAVKTKVADGRTVDMFPAILDEIEIYGQRFTNVVVGLMADQGEQKIPNLLGMNVISKIPIELGPEGLDMTIDPDEGNHSIIYN